MRERQSIALVTRHGISSPDARTTTSRRSCRDLRQSAGRRLRAMSKCPSQRYAVTYPQTLLGNGGRIYHFGRVDGRGAVQYGHKGATDRIFCQRRAVVLPVATRSIRSAIISTHVWT